MKTTIRLMAVMAGLVVAHVAMAQAPAGAPAGATGMCKDGTYWTGATKSGACKGHQGIKDWYAPAKPVAPAAAAPASSPAPAVAPSKPAPAVAAAPAKTASKSSTKTVAPGGGPGLVWLNTSSNVYHCYGGEDYGTTKAGAYMSEADAKAKGGRADHGKPCSK